MVLNYIWVSFFIIAFAVALAKLLIFNDTTVFPAMLQSTFDMAKTGFEISIGLAGVMSLWLGLDENRRERWHGPVVIARCRTIFFKTVSRDT